MPVGNTLGGAIHTYTATFVPSPPPISENVLHFLDTFQPSPPPIREGGVGDFLNLVLDEFLPSPPPIREGFTDGLHDIIDLFQFDDGLGDTGLLSPTPTSDYLFF